jgi:23S rRNA (pseudouridine1915-N3)-methyltransferase
MTSRELAAFLEKRQKEGGALCFAIGGSHGLSQEVKDRAILRLSFSRMTFPHQLFRVMLAEQLYRAFSLSAGGRYHK